MKISLCMIVKNEEKYIQQCLESALEIVDEAVIVDTGSTDNTIDIINKNFKKNVKVINYQWENDFSAARNVSLSHATGDWILILDADEKISCDKAKLLEKLDRPDNVAYIIPIYNFQSSGNIDYSTCMIRLYKNEGCRYEGAIHEQIMFNDGLQTKEVLDKGICKIFHYGYLKSSFDRQGKIERNINIIKSEIAKNPKSAFHWYNLGVMKMIEHKYDDAINHFIKSNKLCNGIRTTFSTDLVLRMAMCMFALKQYKMCEEFLDHALGDNELRKLPDLFYYNGLAKKAQKKYVDAISCFDQCIKIGEVSEGISVRGMGSYLPMLEMARIKELQKKITEAVMLYMEAVLHKNNYLKDGKEEFIHLLRKNNMNVVLDEFEKVLSAAVS